MKIGSKLKELRNAHGYTQEELATILNVSRSTISSWEINRTYPDLSILVSLSGLYEITVDQLINEDDKLIDTMTKHAATNSRLKKVIITLIVGLISFSTVIVFLFNGSRNIQKPQITHYDFSDYSTIVQKENVDEKSPYFYKNYFVAEIIDVLPDGTKTTLIQPSNINSMYHQQATLKLKEIKNMK